MKAWKCAPVTIPILVLASQAKTASRMIVSPAGSGD